MKNSKVLGLFLGLILLTNNAAFSAIQNKTIQANVGTKRIPVGTKIKLKLLDPINSDMMEMGDQFAMVTIEDIKVDNTVIVPCGSIIRGSINKIKTSKMLSRSAIVYLDFDHIVAPTGKQVPLKVGICGSREITVDGGLGTNTNYGTATVQNAKNTVKIVKFSTKWGWEKGNEILSGYPKYILAPLGAMVSTPAAGIYFIGDSIVDVFKKGEDVSLSQGEKIDLMLLKPLDMPVY